MSRLADFKEQYMTCFKNSMALDYGVNSAIVAQYLWDSLYVCKTDCTVTKQQGKEWCRASAIHITSVFPFLSKHQIRNAIDNLTERKVIKKGSFNYSRFDHTNWYCFTEFGKSLMMKRN